MGRGWLLAGLGSHDPARRFHLGSVRSGAGIAFRAHGIWYRLGSGGYRGLSGDVDYRARYPRVGGAFLVPGSLALIDSAFERANRPAAIGTWTAWTGTAFAVGPLLGGLVVDYLSWRWIFVLSAFLMVIAFTLTFGSVRCPLPPNTPASTSSARRCRRSA